MSNLCMGGGGQFVDRSEVALVQTPRGTSSWKPVPHIEVIDAVTAVVKAHHWEITEEQFGLAREGQKLSTDVLNGYKNPLPTSHIPKL